MDSPQPESSTNIESPGSSTSQYSPAAIDPNIANQLSDEERGRLRNLVDAMGRCVQGHDYTKDQLLVYFEMVEFDAVLGFQENFQPQETDASEKKDALKKWLEKKTWKKWLEDGRAVLDATITSQVTPDHQVPDGELDEVLRWLCRVARAMFLGLDGKLGDDNKAREDWKEAICRAADPNGEYENLWDVFWREDDVPEGKVDLGT